MIIFDHLVPSLILPTKVMLDKILALPVMSLGVLGLFNPPVICPLFR